MDQQEEKINTQNKKYICLECKNEVTIETDYEIGNVVECPFCGIEYEITEKEGEEYTMQLIEEEK